MDTYEVEQFLEEEITMICLFAHPTVQEVSSIVDVDNNLATLEISYKSLWSKEKEMTLEIGINEVLPYSPFSYIDVISDEGFLPAFVVGDVGTATAEGYVNKILRKLEGKAVPETRNLISQIRMKLRSKARDTRSICVDILNLKWLLRVSPPEIDSHLNELEE